MPNIDKHSPGSFCWIELATSDQSAAKNFYASLFGWAANDMPMGPDEYYTIFQLENRAAAAAYTLRADRSPGVPPHWMIYISVASADDTAARTAEAGGKVIAAPFEVGEYGRMSVLQDPAGAMFSIWEPKANQGIGITGVDGTLCWADLSTSNPKPAATFYASLFGWEIAPGEHDSSGYLHIKNGESFIGGVPPGRMLPPGVPPHWLLYFLTSGCDALADKAKSLGADIRYGPESIPDVGRMAIMADPQGAVFAIFQPDPRRG